MLRVDRLSAGYHGGRVLHDIDLTVSPGTVHAVVGRNGAGKSTLVHTIAGLLRPYAGTVLVGDRDLTGLPAHRVARAGVGLVPQGRRVFASLTVAEHLTLAASTRRRASADAAADGWSVHRVLEVMPRLAERLRHRGDQLSGGEQQMLAIGRALLTQPRVLLLDEPCEGLAGDLATRIGQLVAGLAGTGMSVLLVEQQLDRALAVADQITVLDYGRVIHRALTAEVRADPGPLEALLSIAHTATGHPPAAPDGTPQDAQVARDRAGTTQNSAHTVSDSARVARDHTARQPVRHDPSPHGQKITPRQPAPR